MRYAVCCRMHVNQESQKTEQSMSTDRRPEEARAWNSTELLMGQTEVIILHGQEKYRLRLTRSGKLILYK